MWTEVYPANLPESAIRFEEFELEKKRYMQKTVFRIYHHNNYI